MATVCFYLLLSCIGICHSLDLNPHSWLYDKYLIRSSQPRYPRQSTVCNLSLDCPFPALDKSEIFCTPGYIQTAVDHIAHCGYDPIQLAHYCAKKKDGTYCVSVNSYFERHFRNCQRDLQSLNCSPQCKSSLQTLRDDYGCCINSLWNISFPPYFPSYLFNYSFWSMCGIETVSSVCSNIATIPPVNPTQSPTECLLTRKQVEILHSILCSPAAQSTVDRLYEGNICRKKVANYLIHICSHKSDGQYCSILDTHYQAVSNVTSSCTQGNETCSTGCRDALLMAKDEIGCCVNYRSSSTAYEEFCLHVPVPDMTFDLWDECNVTSPGVCPSSLSSGCEILTALTFLSVTVSLAL